MFDLAWGDGAIPGCSEVITIHKVLLAKQIAGP